MDDDVEEQQEFLSVSEYRPDEQKTASNDRITDMNQNDGEISKSSGGSGESHRYPQAAFFTVFFKTFAVFGYVFGEFFTYNFILIFVFVILCLACDFWTVKNVTGRLLVGLRWWNHVKEDGSTEWKFESKAQSQSQADLESQAPATGNNKKDSRLFWTSLYLTPCIWILLCVACVVKFNVKWLPLTLVGIALNGAQLWAYWKCQRDAKAQTKSNTAVAW
eukprot:CAMPEP_0202685874 /NCGR_PEP_ID=MMETSP1385-20130828/1707_1 /ASSEMBLY_ACC=CAM_ASM_000861 /TAXON_ID=933848 /ORGANISM="Elphidium margaritaceum" /LENGTH=218 /DNA_ID=CAMNT_0049340343 /DNA_START=33 /DNA_END=686 /DNA_ORIENTATION=+